MFTILHCHRLDALLITTALFLITNYSLLSAIVGRGASCAVLGFSNRPIYIMHAQSSYVFVYLIPTFDYPQVYKITSEECAISSLENSVVTRMVTKDVT